MLLFTVEERSVAVVIIVHRSNITCTGKVKVRNRGVVNMMRAEGYGTLLSLTVTQRHNSIVRE